MCRQVEPGISGVLGFIILGALLDSGLVHGQVNIALARPVNTSSMLETYGPGSKVVDGDTNPYLEGNSCLLTDRINTALAWLTIDFGNMSVIQRIEMTNRIGGTKAKPGSNETHQGHLKGFAMAVSNTTAIPPLSSDVCYRHQDNVLPDVFQNRTCEPGQQIGRYLMIYNTRQDSKDARLEICEVKVIGCRAGYFGQNCSRPCGHCVDGQCLPNNGSCMFGCMDGYLGDNCTEECDEGLYGQRCHRRCGKCHLNETCNHVTGFCTMGCAGGYSGPKCTYVNFAFERPTEVSGNSTSVPGSVTVNGNTTDGQCITTSRSKDNAWWRVDLGQLAVISKVIIDLTTSNRSNRAKSILRKRLHGFEIKVSEEISSSVSDVCYTDMDPELPDLIQNHTCEMVGRYVTIRVDRTNETVRNSSKYSKNAVLELCEVEVVGCAAGKYGENCEFSCPSQCTDSKCFSNATCVFGCNAGYQGSFCNQTCENGTYGKDCQLTCGQCLDIRYCNQVNGECSSGCEKGWMGGKCKRPCTSGYYGTNCTEECGSCINKTACNHTNGVCPVGCASGFQDTPYCTERCENSTFGMNCAQTCGMCRDESACEQTTGICQEGCDPGWQEPYCNTACTSGYYGTDCTEECGSCINKTACNHTNGVCPVGCASGFQDTPYCTERCENNTFGMNCSQTCGMCRNGSACEQTTGICQEGCDPGWQEPYCNTACTSGYYGTNCAEECGSCINKTACNHTNGVCPVGCASDFKDTPYCQERCEKNTFGMNCSQFCGMCRNGSACEQTTRICQEGCDPGWQEPYCNTGCENNTFGMNCSQTCGMCRNGSACEQTTGICQEGCDPGWQEPYCSTECEHGTFGIHCSNTCGKCEAGARCDKVNGICRGGCEPGWQPPMCIKECPKGRYGKDCIETCGNCSNATECNAADGTCRCKPGWKPPQCHKECDAGFFGDNCEGKCAHCKHGATCNRTDGKCPDGCDKGWKNERCDKECDPFFYGASCSSKCGRCLHRAPCNHISGLCANGCEDGWMSLECDQETEQPSSAAAIGASIGSSFLVVVLLGIAAFFVIKKRRSSKPPESNELGGMPPIDIPMFLSNRLQSNELHEEFKQLPDGAVHDCTSGQKPENKSRNRYLTTFPYEHSRVILRGGENDYINANFIDSLEKKNAYVATQGPKKNTLVDFWAMLWQNKSDKIIMLANCIEMGKPKVEQYWPDKGHSRDFGEYRVVNTSEQVFAAFTVRMLSLYENECQTPMEVVQFHFTKWPDHGIPDIIHLVNFYKHVQSTETKFNGPMVVHCSAGIGRTGTFIAIDALVHYGTLKGKVVPLDYAKLMRENRMNMIQTKEQYVAVHEVLLDYFICDDLTLTIAEFQEDAEHMSGLQDEFMTLCKYRPTITVKDSSDAMSEANISKNKDLEIIPANRYRPYLMSQSPERNNYINAVILPSCKTEIAFLVTQMPTDDTVDEFWAMVFDYQSTAIVILDPDEKTLPSKSNPTAVTQSFSVQHAPMPEAPNNFEHVRVQNIAITRKGLTDSFLTSSFEVTKWPGEESQSVTPIIQANYAVQTSQYSHKSPGPVTVVCRNGSERCGVFCALSNAAETLNMNRTANVFLTIRQLQYRRPSFIRTLYEYKLCYRAVTAHCETITDYGNV